MISFFLPLMLFLGFGYCSDDVISQSDIVNLPLTQDFNKASKLAKVYKLPMVLVFTGSDWCDNSKKLLNTLQTKEFFHLMKNNMIFVQADFPEINKAKRGVLETNFELKQRYGIEEFPTILLMTEDQEKISQIGYSNENSLELAAHMKELMSKYKELDTFLETCQESTSAEVLESKYEEVKKLGSEALVVRFIDKGMSLEKGIFFHLEKYTLQLVKGFEDESLKQIILNRDKKGHYEAFLKLALCDFQELSKKHPNDPDKAIQPLLKCVEKQGINGNASLWKVHNLIAKHLKTKKAFTEALFHARLSQKEAPESYQKEIRKLIKECSKEIATHQDDIQKESFDELSPSALR